MSYLLVFRQSSNEGFDILPKLESDLRARCPPVYSHDDEVSSSRWLEKAVEVVASNYAGEAKIRIEFGMARERQQTEPLLRK